MRRIHAAVPLIAALLAGCGGSASAPDAGGARDARLRAMADAAAAADAVPKATRAAPRTVTTRTIAAPLSLSAVVRSPAPTAGSVSVGVRQRIELDITVTGGVATAPYDPDPAHGGIDVWAVFTVGNIPHRADAFFDGARWRVRFAPDATGAASYTVYAQDASVAGAVSTTGTERIAVVAGNAPGWLRIGGHFLTDSAGGPAFPIGHDTGWQYDVWHPSPATMRANGENLLGFWLAVPWADPASSDPTIARRCAIEQAPGGVWTYDQGACGYLDGVVDAAAAAGVRLWPALWSHGQLRVVGQPNWGQSWWTQNAYSSVCAASDFFLTTDANGADTEQWRRQKNFFRYVVARWGASTAIAGWTSVVEVEGTTGWYFNPARVESWSAAVAAWFRAHDAYRASAGGAYPIVASRSDAPAWDNRSDMRSIDRYHGSPYGTIDAQASNATVGPDIAADTRTMWASGKPAFHGEFGGDISLGATQPTHLHNGLWAGLAGGACLSPLVWTDTGQFPLMDTGTTSGDAMLATMASFARFVADSPVAADPRLAPATISAGTPCKAWAMASRATGFAWVFNPSGAIDRKSVSIGGFARSQSVTVSWYDPWAPGYVLTQSATARNGTLSLTAPTTRRGDIALSFAPTAVAAR